MTTLTIVLEFEDDEAQPARLTEEAVQTAFDTWEDTTLFGVTAFCDGYRCTRRNADDQPDYVA